MSGLSEKRIFLFLREFPLRLETVCAETVDDVILFSFLLRFISIIVFANGELIFVERETLNKAQNKNVDRNLFEKQSIAKQRECFSVIMNYSNCNIKTLESSSFVAHLYLDLAILTLCSDSNVKLSASNCFQVMWCFS